MFKRVGLWVDFKIIIFRLMGLLDLVFYEQKKKKLFSMNL